jgi:tetratricopeptide (TPR) repeat protein
VEIFPRKQDFAVRTFGLPGAEGFLGVCFGPVITANSPASQGQSPSSWEAVLWHEFCHTVTLHKTRNKMPRWLSEGISVYEEMQENHGWGQWLTPQYRQMILGKELTPLSQLSSAFLSPKTPLHLRFAYFESAMAVEFLIRRHGFDALKALLDDLGNGLPVNEALTRRTMHPLERLDQDFAEFARERARGVASGATWDKPDLPDSADAAALEAWLERHPKNFWGLQRFAVRLVQDENWQRAEKTLKELQALYPEYAGSSSAYELLAEVYRHTPDPAKERAALDEWTARDVDAVPAFLRLIELGEAAGDWLAVANSARRLLAVNPLIPAPHRGLAKAAEKLGERDEAMSAYRALLQLGDPDAANIHYRLALLLRQSGAPDAAKREVLKALEEAPRFLEAHKLLLELVEKK